MARTERELLELLNALRSRPENEIVEFKQVSGTFDKDKLGRYVSALANEANLQEAEAAWLIFGVRDNGEVTGTSFRELPGQLHTLKQEIAQHLTVGHGFRQAHEVFHEDGRVVMFEIPPAPAGIPVEWKGQYCARNGESLANLSTSKLDEFRRQTAGDWSAETCAAALISDLDPQALVAARVAFAASHSRIAQEDIQGWTNELFLERVGLLVRGKLTRACIVLLGKESASSLLGQVAPEVTWILAEGERVYEHLGLPFFTVGDRAYGRIRNYQIRLLQPGALLQTEVQKYDPQSILEAIHNCIAHMDYREGARISLAEHADRLVFTNAGEFFDGEPQDYMLNGRMARKYRNPALVQAMTKLNMIDRVGYGIALIGQSQAKRFLPLPDYVTDATSVSLTVYGAEIDSKYSELLMQRTDLSLVDIFALDRVQKGRRIPPEVVGRLRRAKIIEGRAPRLHISAALASATGAQADYMRARTIEDEHYLKLLLDYIEKFGPVQRASLDEFVWDKLHESLDESQKRNKVQNLLKKLKAQGRVETIGVKRGARWQITQTGRPKT